MLSRLLSAEHGTQVMNKYNMNNTIVTKDREE